MTNEKGYAVPTLDLEVLRPKPRRRRKSGLYGGRGTHRNSDETMWPGPPDLPRCIHSGLKTAVATGSLEQIQEADWFQYRYLSLDRPNLQFVAKECSTEMTEPCQRHLSLVKKAAR